MDPAALAQRLGSNPSAALAWVANETRLIPYKGSLRGPVGTLLDRAGSSLDRARLLAELLSRNGYEVRFARASLSPDVARTYLPAAAPPPRALPTVAGFSPDEVLARHPRLDSANFRAQIAAIVEASAREDPLVADVSRMADGLAMILGQPGTASAINRWIDAATDYWWVQVHDGPVWRDLDPAGPSARTPDAIFNQDAIPSDLFHTVTFRISIEKMTPGGLAETVVQQRSMRVADLAGLPVKLSFRPGSIDISVTAGGSASSGESLPGRLAQEQVWVPGLVVGSEIVVDNVLTVWGEVIPYSEATLAGLAKQIADKGAGPGQLGNSIGGGFFGAGGALDRIGESKPESKPDVLTAVFLDIIVQVPGEPATVHRREVWDRLGPAARAAGVSALSPLDDGARLARARLLTSEFEFLCLNADFLTPVVFDNLISAIRERGGALVEAVAAGVAGTEVSVNPPTKPVAQEVTLFVMRQAGLLPDMSGFRVRPNIVASRHLSRFGDATNLGEQTRFDIVANEREVVATPAEAFVQRLKMGVADTLAETEAVGDTARANTATRYREDLGRGTGWSVVRRPDLARLATAGLSSDVVARLDSELANGRLVIAPSEYRNDIDFVWWRIDPVTGTSLGIGPDGTGQTAGEQTTLFARLVTLYACSRAIGSETEKPNPSDAKMVSLVFCLAGTFFRLPKASLPWMTSQRSTALLGAWAESIKALDSLGEAMTAVAASIGVNQLR